MTILSLPVKDPQDLSMILSALQREKKLLEWEIRKTKDILEKSEKKCNLSSKVFYEKYQMGEMGDDESIMVWAGEFQFFLRFTEKLSRLEELIAECQKLINASITIPEEELKGSELLELKQVSKEMKQGERSFWKEKS